MKAFDGQLQTETSFIVTVTPVNDAPSKFHLLTPVDSIIIEINNDNLNDTLVFEWEISLDIDSDTVSYVLDFTNDLIILNPNETQILQLQFSYDYLFSVMSNNDLSIISGNWSVISTDGVISTSTINGPFYLTIDASRVSIKDVLTLPTEYALHQNYPNPFNPVTTIQYDLPEQSHVQINVHDILGRQIITLINKIEEPGFKSAIWDSKNQYGENVSSGIYIYQIIAKSENGVFIRTKKLVLLQ